MDIYYVHTTGFQEIFIVQFMFYTVFQKLINNSWGKHKEKS